LAKRILEGLTGYSAKILKVTAAESRWKGLPAEQPDHLTQKNFNFAFTFRETHPRNTHTHTHTQSKLNNTFDLLA